MWLPTHQRFTRNAKSPYTDTRKMSTDQRKGIYRSYLPGHYIVHSTHIPPLLQKLQEETGTSSNLKKDWYRIFNKPPLVIYTRPTSLRDRLVSTKFKTVNNALLPKVCEACGKPKFGWCKESRKPPLLPAVTTIKSLEYVTL